MKDMLVFPKGIRLANSEDLFNFPDCSEMLNKVSSAKIKPGYKLFLSDNGEFQNYAEINIDSQHIWNLFNSLCRKLLPIETITILGGIEDEEKDLFKSDYVNTLEFLEQFERFKFYFANDCNIQFGFAASLLGNVHEVFVTPTKHFRVWTDKVGVLESVMREYNLVQTNDLQFIDEFPRVTVSLEYDEVFHDHKDLISHLIEVVS